jgi:hypothetical protein
LQLELDLMANTIQKKEHLIVSFSDQDKRNDVGQSCAEMLAEFAEHPPELLLTAPLKFTGMGKYDVYNITAPFRSDGQWIIAARVESRSSEISTAMFFQRGGRSWSPVDFAPRFPGLQDPCICRIGAELVLGAVRFPVGLQDGSHSWRMEFYRGKTIQTLEKFFVGPEGMKDIRLCGLQDSRVAVLSRPQGDTGGLGKIGFRILESLDDLTADAVQRAPVFNNQFKGDEWGGANEVHLLANGLLGVLGHVACFDVHKNRHYYPMTFALDPQTGVAGPINIIATRALFPAGPAKRLDLTDVVFTGGLIRHWDGTADLFAGLSDASAGFIRIPDPFLQYEHSDSLASYRESSI